MMRLASAAKIHLVLNDINLLDSHPVAKYNKSEYQNLQDLKETGEGLVMFKFKHGYVEKLLFVAISLNSNKNRSFMVDIQQTFIK